MPCTVAKYLSLLFQMTEGCYYIDWLCKLTMEVIVLGCPLKALPGTLAVGHMHHDGCNTLQEDPYSGLIGDSWRSSDEKAQFRLELQRMVTVSAVP